MDGSQPPEDIAHTSSLNDGGGIFAPLGNYLYRFVSVHLLAVCGHVCSPLWQKYSTEMQPGNS